MSTPTLQTSTHAPQTLGRIELADAVRDSIGQALAVAPDPDVDIDRSMARYHQILDFGRHSDTPGVGYVRNLPVDAELPATPANGGPATGKKTFVAEGVLLGLSGLLGEPEPPPPPPTPRARRARTTSGNDQQGQRARTTGRNTRRTHPWTSRPPY
ncbi:hypothetical protein [Streptomyces johnsoniae]|uniref:Uncharacterized protein n=1 Tax=Streptomyces johnsoniae TaxID=3075532 RepID=A0ABU2SFU8_9ACTN|nr:hypothetical protein [Streptomyces sp. DSM 41886]MDT0446960.1 hypothetical protein [Streptomyces sp. DSM 41886]